MEDQEERRFRRQAREAQREDAGRALTYDMLCVALLRCWEEIFYTPPPPRCGFRDFDYPELIQKLPYTTPSGWW